MREPPPFSKVPAMTTMRASDLPLPRIGRGKVRDIYAVGDDRVLLLTTDRISAFDVVMAETIPMKGAVLTQISAWWFRQLGDVLKHHMISADADEIVAAVPALKPHRAAVAGRAMLCRRGTVFPIECVIRGYLSGSAWREYSKSATLAGEKLPSGLKESGRLDPPKRPQRNDARCHAHGHGQPRRGDEQPIPQDDVRADQQSQPAQGEAEGE